MGLISRVSSRTYREKNMDGHPDAILKTPRVTKATFKQPNDLPFEELYQKIQVYSFTTDEAFLDFHTKVANQSIDTLNMHNDTDVMIVVKNAVIFARATTIFHEQCVCQIRTEHVRGSSGERQELYRY